MRTPGLFPKLSLAAAVLLLLQAPFARAASLSQASPSTMALSSLPPVERGDLLMIHQQYLAAIDAYRQAPTDAETLNKMGIAYHHLFAIDEARKSYEKALLIRPDYPEAINNLGAADFSQGDYKKAIRLYRKALKLMPHSAVIAANLGTAYFARGKYDNGLEAYQTAFRIDPTVFDANSPAIIQGPANPGERAHQDFCIAELFAEAGKDSLALDYLRRALDAGFRDRNHILQDTELAQLRKTPEFAQLMAEEKIR
ncbi:MAG: tetratricopeptide repeat protein [Acidobacteriaceae bacterium]